MSRPRGRGHRALHLMAVSCALAAVVTLSACGAKHAPSPSGQPQVLGAPGTVIMVIRHGEKPAGSTSAMGIDAASWPSDRFDVVWTFTATASGWTFAQVPEMVLPRDRPTILQ